jgi:hypothetical protein
MGLPTVARRAGWLARGGAQFGVGAVAFMVGAGAFTVGRVQLGDQCFLMGAQLNVFVVQPLICESAATCSM